MKTAVFAKLWDSLWPHRTMDPQALHLVWGPWVRQVQPDQALEFVRAWAADNAWPPSLHDFLVGVGLKKPRSDVPTPATSYTCEFCSEKIEGPVAYGNHLEAAHPDTMATPEQAAAALDGWKPSRPPKSATAPLESGPTQEPSTLEPPTNPPTPEQPEVPEGGTREPGCTICTGKLQGVVFRENPEGKALAAFCWGCAHLGCRNVHRLPVPTKANRNSWKRFEHAFPDLKRMKKRDRDRFASEAVARSRAIFKAKADQEAATADAASEPDACKRCGGGVGLLYRRLDGPRWIAGLCPACGGSPTVANPPEFLGPPVPLAEDTPEWVPMSGTPAADLGGHEREQFRKRAMEAALAAAKNPAPLEGGTPKVTSGQSPPQAEGGEPSDVGSPKGGDVSTEPPPV